MILALMLALLGCSDRAGQAPEQAISQGGQSEEAGQLTASVTDPNLTLVITPSAPNASSELKAMAGGNPTQVRFEWRVNGVPVKGNSSNRLAPGCCVRGDRVVVSLFSALGTVSATTEILNSPPAVVATQFVEPRLHTGISIEIDAETSDADADPVEIRYSWTLNGEMLDGYQENILPGALLHRGDRVSFTAIPNDGLADGPAYVASEFSIPNGAPRFVSNYPRSFSNFLYQYPARAEDPDADPLRYRLETGPEGMSIDADSGELRWEISASQSGEHHVSISAEDAEGLKATQEFTLNVRIPE